MAGEMLQPPIVLIGPNQAGKTTAGKLVAERLGWPFHQLARLAPDYRSEIGYDDDAARAAWKEGGFDAIYRFMMPLDAHAVERILAEHRDGVIELQPAQSVYDEPALLDRVREALRTVPHVVLLVPSADPEISFRILDERSRTLIDGIEINEHFIRHPSNGLLARHVVYTKGRTPAQTCEEVAGLLDPSASEVILIGPMGAGKSTVGKLLAERLGVPQVPMDDRRWDYYKEIGWDESVQNEIGAREGFAGVYRYWKPFELHAVERLLSENRGCVIDFGAGHSVYEDDAQLARARDLLATYPNVVLLLPSPDPGESAQILRDRGTPMVNGMAWNRFILTHRSNEELATIVIYNQGHTPEETADAIIRQCVAMEGKRESPKSIP